MWLLLQGGGGLLFLVGVVWFDNLRFFDLLLRDLGAQHGDVILLRPHRARNGHTHDDRDQ
jgi:hypothetical protein